MSTADGKIERFADLIADRVAERLADRLAEMVEANGAAGATDDAPGGTAPLVDAAEIARRFGISRDYVYEHADELGASRLGDGPRARLRFDPRQVAEALAPEPSPVTDPNKPRRKARPTSSVELLPIGRKGRRS